jgi:hypothetical protein
MRTATIRTTGLALVAAVSAAAAVAAGSAQAASIHACVKPHSGVTRIVTAKARCRHGEKKLSWSTTGPQGKTGPAGGPGAGGANGANGTGPAFATDATEVEVTTKSNVMLEKSVPPGSYVVSGSLILTAKAATAKFVDVFCLLGEDPGTSFTISEGEPSSVKVLSFVGWEVPLAQESATEFDAVTTMPLAVAFTTSVTTTLGLVCLDDQDTPAGVTVRSPSAVLIATRVSSVS